MDSNTLLNGPEGGDYLSDYYANNGKRLAEKIPIVSNSENVRFPTVNTEFDFYFIPLHIV